MHRFKGTSTWLLLFLSMGLCLPSTWAKSPRHKQVHRLRRDVIKEVKAHLGKKHMWLHWYAPSGKLIRYKARNLPAGFRIHLDRLAKAGAKRIAVGGRYDLNTSDTGVVTPAFVYAIANKWRGVRVVKFDGLMPLFTATQLPATKGKPATAYTLYGMVSSKLHNYDNKLVCLYGTWFQLKSTKRPNRVSQSRGIKGRSLFFFKARYRTPRTWRMLADPAAKRRAFFAAKARKKKGLPPLKRTLQIPTLAPDRHKKHLAICQKRLSKWERKFTTKPVRPAPPKPRTK